MATNNKSTTNILRISDDKDMINDVSLLKKYINKHDTMINDTYKKLWNAYSCNARILDTQAVPAKANYKPDYRIAVNYPRYIVDTYSGFARGIPVKIISDDSALMEYINAVIDNNDMDDVFAELHKLKCIFGESYQIAYIDEDGEVGSVPVGPMDAFPVYDNSIRPRLRYFVRTYYDEDNKRHGSISDDENVYYFDYEGDIVYTETRPHGFGAVPVVVYTMNSARIGLIATVLSMCDAYDKAISEKMNDVDAFADAIMKVLGSTLTEDQMRDLRSKRIINVGGKDGSNVIVDFLARPSGDTTQEHLLERLEKLIFTISMVCNVSDDNFATSSGIALKMKMTPMSNLAAGDWRLDQSSMKKFWRMVLRNPVNSFSEDDAVSLTFNHYLNYPEDQADAVATAKGLDGIVSRRTQISVLPSSIVSDVAAELEQIETEAYENAELAVKLQEITQTEEETSEETEAAEE